MKNTTATMKALAVAGMTIGLSVGAQANESGDQIAPVWSKENAAQVTVSAPDGAKAEVYTNAVEAAKTGDTPQAMIGVVAQRYPWNGMLDVQYKTLFTNASRKVTFYANGIVLGTAQGTGGQMATASFDLNEVADGAFKNKALKDVKVTVAVE